MAHRRELIHDPLFRGRDWQIGSGPIEFQCNSVSQRSKGRGHTWDRANAEALMALDCPHSSHVYHLYWTTLDPTSN